MFRNPKALVGCLAVVASMCAVSLGPPAASAAASCDQRILVDWSNNARIDGVYPLDCYERAIAALPLDLRDYSNAEEVIGRALTAALRTSPSDAVSGDGQPQAASDTTALDDSSLPLPLVLVAVAALALLAAGALGYVSRRRRT